MACASCWGEAVPVLDGFYSRCIVLSECRQFVLYPDGGYRRVRDSGDSEVVLKPVRDQFFVCVDDHIQSVDLPLHPFVSDSICGFRIKLSLGMCPKVTVLFWMGDVLLSGQYGFFESGSRVWHWYREVWKNTVWLAGGVPAEVVCLWCGSKG